MVVEVLQSVVMYYFTPYRDTLQDNAPFAVEIFISLAVWHYKNKEKSKKQQSNGFQRKVDAVLKYTISCLLFDKLNTSFRNTDV